MTLQEHLGGHNGITHTVKNLRNIFSTLEKRCDKFEHYFPLYEKWFEKFVGKSPKILEIGVYGGGSLEMWSKWFGPGTQVYGVDINKKCRKYNDKDNNINVIIGDQSSEKFWKEAFENIKDFDIIIDDGSHESPHQIQTLISTYNLLKDGGIYWCEDTHTSYYPNRLDGGYKNPKSFIEYSKNVIDVLSDHHTRFAIGYGNLTGPYVDQKLVKLFNNIQGIHFYDSIVVIEKGPRLDFKRVIVNNE